MAKSNKYSFVCIILPTYNGEKYLAKSIESVLSQTFTNYTLLIVDDGSKDKTLEIINFYKRKDNRVKLIKSSHLGPVAILNYGITKVKSKWIARLDQDDIWLPTKLEAQIKIIKANSKISLIGTGFYEIDELGFSIKKHLFPKSNFLLKFNLRRLKRFFPNSSSLFKTSAIKKIGGYNLNLYMADDWALWSSMLTLGEFYCVNEALVKVRRHSQQRSFADRGNQQLIHSVASITYHFINTHYHSHLKDQYEWRVFISWIQNELESINYLSHRIKINILKSLVTDRKISIPKKIFFILCNFNQVNFFKILLAKYFGTSLPRKLALAWVEKISQKEN